MNFYVYTQNNPGGELIFTDELSVFVAIEAENPEDSDEHARRLGIYFDGVEDGVDCRRCGDRWFRTSDDKYSKINIEKEGSALAYMEKKASWEIRWNDIMGYIHYASGHKDTIYAPKKEDED